MPAESWLYVEKEKAPDMLHVLAFPYNGEPPRVRLLPKLLFFFFGKFTKDV